MLGSFSVTSAYTDGIFEVRREGDTIYIELPNNKVLPISLKQVKPGVYSLWVDGKRLLEDDIIEDDVISIVEWRVEDVWTIIRFIYHGSRDCLLAIWKVPAVKQFVASSDIHEDYLLSSKYDGACICAGVARPGKGLSIEERRGSYLLKFSNGLVFPIIRKTIGAQVVKRSTLLIFNSLYVRVHEMTEDSVRFRIIFESRCAFEVVDAIQLDREKVRCDGCEMSIGEFSKLVFVGGAV